ncbi:FAD-dependent monooxygenase [Nonomuraea endophytica]|uniref:2-polyprenyl-6-methoxyphenol hydroxylase-like FAD-dependent oxidoreductase n=1 Tax=Nonomuraea endophytica TaxID=714136 RepID=A0A7W8EE64_9ACTN|nr:FAD-dependent monooxygenase [Nonomuraea endophytica]MBB5075012.1 2-polyprenyl-6-methoxyphenol hydroxylase-like FAD-dependent oxidoreductase [Nonomuraea endophytica]
MKVIIVGGGIGGLATAVALHQRGIQVEVLERAAEFTEVGAGLSIQPNGLRALDALGLGEHLRAGVLAGPPAGIRNSRGDWLIRNDVDDLKRRFGPWVTVHRAALIGLLRAAVPAEALRPGTAVQEVRPDGTVRHSGGVSTADVVVGADGVHSVTRGSLWPSLSSPRYVGYTTWRFIAPPQPVEESVETWGRGERFGYLPMPDGRIYCYVMANAPAGSDIGLNELRERFARWHRPIPALLESVAEEAVLQRDTHELPKLPTYVSGNVALLGDAAHAMTPNLGQGACQALEDAVTLAHTLDTLGPRAGLAAYDRARRPRTQMIVRRSRQVGAPAHWTSTPMTTLRDAALPLLPKMFFNRSLTPTYTWTI